MNNKYAIDQLESEKSRIVFLIERTKQGIEKTRGSVKERVDFLKGLTYELQQAISILKGEVVAEGRPMGFDGKIYIGKITLFDVIDKIKEIEDKNADGEHISISISIHKGEV